MRGARQAGNPDNAAPRAAPKLERLAGNASWPKMHQRAVALERHPILRVILDVLADDDGAVERRGAPRGDCGRLLVARVHGEPDAAGSVEDRHGLEPAIGAEEVRALCERERMRHHPAHRAPFRPGRRDEHVVDIDGPLARDDEVVAEEQFIDIWHGAGDGAFHRHDGVACPAVGDGVERLLERGARHEPGAGAEKRLCGFFAVRPRGALIRGLSERFVRVYMLHFKVPRVPTVPRVPEVQRV